MDTTSDWRKSSYSGNGGANCVEVGANGSVRDTKEAHMGSGRTVLAFGADAWRSAVADIKAGTFKLNHR